MDAILTAESPQQLIDKLAVQRVVASDLSVQLERFRVASEQADQAEQASAKSAEEARTAAEQAAAVRAELQAKQSRCSCRSRWSNRSTTRSRRSSAPRWPSPGRS